MALGHLVMSCGNLVFIDLIEHLLAELGRNDNMSTTRTYIQCTAAISRQAGHRIGEYLEKIIPLVVKFCNVDDDELREYCIQAFESFVRRYGAAVPPPSARGRVPPSVCSQVSQGSLPPRARRHRHLSALPDLRPQLQL